MSEVWLLSGRARSCCLGRLHICEDLGRQHVELCAIFLEKFAWIFLKSKIASWKNHPKFRANSQVFLPTAM